MSGTYSTIQFLAAFNSVDEWSFMGLTDESGYLRDPDRDRWHAHSMSYYIISLLVMECNYINSMSRLQVFCVTSSRKSLWQICKPPLNPLRSMQL